MNKTIIAGALVLGLGSTSCLGTNNAFNGINNWNAGVTQQDWVNELIYIGLWIIPVYPLALTGDALIFNTIDYWSGDNVFDDSEFPDSFGSGSSDE